MPALGSTQNSHTNNYTLGRGEVYVDRITDVETFTMEGERYIGNSPEFNLTISQEVLDHFSSDHGIREKDESVPLEVNRTGSLSVDNIHVDNVALFFFGSTSVVTDAGGAFTEVLNNVKTNRYYQLGMSSSFPAGRKGFDGDADESSNSAGAYALYPYNDSNSITPEDSNSGVVAYVNGTDYTFDPILGRLYIIDGGAITDGLDVYFSGTVKAQTFDRVISGSEPVACAIRFIAFNPTGSDIDYYMPYCKLSPNGDYALKGDDWQTIPMSVEVLKRSDREAIYADGRPAFT